MSLSWNYPSWAKLKAWAFQFLSWNQADKMSRITIKFPNFAPITMILKKILRSFISTKGVFRVEKYNLATKFCHFQYKFVMKINQKQVFNWESNFGQFLISSWSEKGHKVSHPSAWLGLITTNQLSPSQPGTVDYIQHINTTPPPPPLQMFKPSYGLVQSCWAWVLLFEARARARSHAVGWN